MERTRDEQIAAARGLVKLYARRGETPSALVQRIAAEPYTWEKRAKA